MNKKEKRQAKLRAQRSAALRSRILGWRPGSRMILGCALVFSALVYTCFATGGTWKLMDAETYGLYYDSLAKSLPEGRLEVDLDAISGEAMLVNGKVYGYFGFAPALPRILLDRIWPRYYGCWSRLSVVLAAVLHILLIGLILRHLDVPLNKPLPLAFLASVIAGSTLIFLTCRPYTYHEASIWSTALALLSAYWILLCFSRPSLKLAAGAAAAATFASWCRLPAGFAALVACLVLMVYLALVLRRRIAAGGPEGGTPGKEPGTTPSPASLRLQVAVLAAGVVVSFVSYVWLNYARFGTFLDGMPAKYMVQMTNERLQNIHGTYRHPEFAPALAWEYLSPTVLSLRSSFPWIDFTHKSLLHHKKGGFDIVEPHAGLLAVAPGLALLALWGVIYGVRKFPRPLWHRWLLLSLFSAFPALLTVAAISYRYLHDLFPFLAVAGAFGLAWLERGERIRHLARIRVFTVVLLLWSIPANLSLTLIFRNEFVWGVEEKNKTEYREVQRKINSFFHVADTAARRQDTR